MHTGGRVVLSANKAGQIRNLLNQYIVESNSGTYDYVKALAAFSSRDEGALSFKKGEVIAVVPKHDAYTEKVIILFFLRTFTGFLLSCVMYVQEL